MELLHEEPITFAEAKEIMEKKDKKNLSYEQNNALEHLSKFTKLSVDKTVKLKKELSQIKKLKAEHVVQICNFLPTTKDELKTILYKDYALFEDSELNTILEIVKKFL
ncbi:MAG: RNA polymerase Rpb4 family protein [Candidatus Aenigmarchaeota archaeon]|jgi:DNA-directed RNA polymerase subunit F|nr:RNA polymerase Rpb4 family protein [Candidatus Aenigmarchaeota archaeon]